MNWRSALEGAPSKVEEFSVTLFGKFWKPKSLEAIHTFKFYFRLIKFAYSSRFCLFHSTLCVKILKKSIENLKKKNFLVSLILYLNLSLI